MTLIRKTFEVGSHYDGRCFGGLNNNKLLRTTNSKPGIILNPFLLTLRQNTESSWSSQPPHKKTRVSTSSRLLFYETHICGNDSTKSARAENHDWLISSERNFKWMQNEGIIVCSLSERAWKANEEFRRMNDVTCLKTNPFWFRCIPFEDNVNVLFATSHLCCAADKKDQNLISQRRNLFSSKLVLYESILLEFYRVHAANEKYARDKRKSEQSQHCE